MSTAIVEQPMAAHTTIYGFSTASPFKARASEKDGRVGAAAAAPPPLLCPAAAEKRCSGLQLSSSAAAAPQSPQLTRQLSSALQTPSAPAKHVAWEHGYGGDDADKQGSQQPGSHVGWEALLDCSRHSGSSGVVGAAAAGDDIASLTNVKIEICCTAHTTPAVRRLVKSVARGLRACQDPEQACNGMGGTYFFMNESGGKAAIIKPCDEEPLAPNNPNGYVGRQLGDPGWKPTVRVGEAAMREVAAHLLDHEGFAKVPTSVLVRARHPIFCYNSRMRSVRMSVPDMASMLHGGDGGLAGPLPMKLGSLQEFVQHDCDTSEMGPSRFSARDVHRIAILDIRLFNTDRHAGNMLVRVARDPLGGSSGAGGAAAAGAAGKSSFMGVPTPHELIPIDHGFCLPETLESPYLEWMYWPQAMLAFSDDELAYIRSLDIEADKELLRKELPSLRPECLRVMEVATTLLKRGAEAGLTLFDIASVMTRPFGDGGEESSDLEKICAYAKQCVEYRRQANAQASSDEDDEFDVDCEEEEIDRLSLSTGGGGDTPRAAGLAGISGARELLFDMEEDGGIASLYEVRVDTAAIMAMAAVAVGGGVKASSRGAATFSPGTSLSSADASTDLSDTMTITTLLSSSTIGRASSTSTNQALEIITPVVTVARIGGMSGGFAQQVPSGAAASALLQQGASAAPAGTQAVARSVHVTEGFLWRNMKGRQSTLRRCTKAVTPKATAPQAYPPPVAAVSPDALSGCFTNMTEDEWGWFMHVYEKQLQEAISSGKWKHGAADTGAAMSCPRF